MEKKGGWIVAGDINCSVNGVQWAKSQFNDLSCNSLK